MGWIMAATLVVVGLCEYKEWLIYYRRADHDIPSEACAL